MFKVKNEDIDKLVELEYGNACSYGPKYHSNHEYYAILREEIEEIDENMMSMSANGYMLWAAIKQENEDDIKEHTNEIEKSTYNAVKEALQVLAVIKKYKDGV